MSPIAKTVATSGRTDRLVWCTSLLALLAFTQSGCSFYRNNLADSRLDQGLTIVLPGIEGKSVFNSGISYGLEIGDVETGIQVYDWTSGFAPFSVIHLRDSARHRREAERLSELIVSYQSIYPGRPVYLVGHSGGAAMSLLTLKALPPDRKVTAVFLLAPAISPQFPIEETLPKTEAGIWNYYSALDFPLLVAGTSLVGTLDGKHMPASGAFGFRELESANQKGPELTQVGYHPKMLGSFHVGGHLGWASPLFVRNYIAPIINRETKLRSDLRLSRRQLLGSYQQDFAPSAPRSPQDVPAWPIGSGTQTIPAQQQRNPRYEN